MLTFPGRIHILFFALFLSSCTNKDSDIMPSVEIGRGLASWYGPGFHGKKTANGERFNMNAYTAAHRKLKFGTLLRITNTRNDLSIVVRINDRGPYNYKRFIDLSKGAANKINMIETGLDEVNAEIVGYNRVNNACLYKHFRNLLIIYSEK